MEWEVQIFVFQYIPNTFQWVLHLHDGVIESSVHNMAQKYSCDGMIHCKCYTHFYPRPTNCHKKKRSHTKQHLSWEEAEVVETSAYLSQLKEYTD